MVSLVRLVLSALVVSAAATSQADDLQIASAEDAASCMTQNREGLEDACNLLQLHASSSAETDKPALIQQHAEGEAVSADAGEDMHAAEGSIFGSEELLSKYVVCGDHHTTHPEDRSCCRPRSECVGWSDQGKAMCQLMDYSCDPPTEGCEWMQDKTALCLKQGGGATHQTHSSCIEANPCWANLCHEATRDICPWNL